MSPPIKPPRVVKVPIPVVVHNHNGKVDPNIGTTSESASCAAGEQVVAGGYALNDASLTVDRSAPMDAQGNPPSPGPPAAQWNVEIHNPQRRTASITIYVVS